MELTESGLETSDLMHHFIFLQGNCLPCSLCIFTLQLQLLQKMRTLPGLTSHVNLSVSLSGACAACRYVAVSCLPEPLGPQRQICHAL